MENLWKVSLWNQFGASIDMLENAIHACPGTLWEASLWNDPEMGPRFSEFWYLTYHTLFWLDLYLSGSVKGFAPPEPYNLDELDPRGLMPERVYSVDELLSYLAYCRKRCSNIIEGLTDEKVQQVSIFPWRNAGLSYLELLLDNMRHVQEHGAQLNMFLGQQAGLTSSWVAQARVDESP